MFKHWDLFFYPIKVRYVFRLFLFFKKFERQRSYKRGSYSERVYTVFVYFDLSSNNIYAMTVIALYMILLNFFWFRCNEF